MVIITVETAGDLEYNGSDVSANDVISDVTNLDFNIAIMEMDILTLLSPLRYMMVRIIHLLLPLHLQILETP